MAVTYTVGSDGYTVSRTFKSIAAATAGASALEAVSEAAFTPDHVGCQTAAVTEEEPA